MTLDYDEIKRDNERRYGTDIGRIGGMLLADRYDDRTHFIFELLQNAEDALARRNVQNGQRGVDFKLTSDRLMVSHHGAPFDKHDVRGICGIAESTKSDKAIGRFGIGFKSVYAFTDRPEIHSGSESFAIESYVWPRRIEPIQPDLGKTTFVLPFRNSDPDAANEILSGLRRLGPRTLLFLREIDEIAWSTDDGLEGTYVRDAPQHLNENLREVTVIGEERTVDDLTEETWLIFSRDVVGTDGAVGQVEIGFALDYTDDGTTVIRPVPDATLIVYFPTIVPTKLGFFIQGPYRTTPSRDNIERRNSWNQHLLQQSADLLIEALRTLRDLDLLSVEALQSLPLEVPAAEESITAPFFEAVRAAFKSEPLLPRYSGGYIHAGQAMIAGSQAIRELFSPTQVATLFETDDERYWLSELITQDRTPNLRSYLKEHLDVQEVEPWTLISRLTAEFLEAQSDEWIIELYKFFSNQTALLRMQHFPKLPLVRLEDGRHVVPFESGEPNAYLPGNESSEFPTAKRSICEDDASRQFLETLSLSEADLVDDVLTNTLPKYESPTCRVSMNVLASDIQRLLRAFETDSERQRNRLTDTLSESYFVPSVDAGNEVMKKLMRPPEVYLATDRLCELFDGVHGVFLVDRSPDFMSGERMRTLLEASGATRYLKPVEFIPEFTPEELKQMREATGERNATSDGPVKDYYLRGLGPILELLPSLAPADARRKAELLWEALHDLRDRRGQGLGVFKGEYRWFYYSNRRCSFDAQWVNDLNNHAWVPNPDNTLRKPGDVVFETIDPAWEDEPFLRSIIEFRPPVVDALAAVMGLEPGVLSLLKDLGVTTEAELRARLMIEQPQIVQVRGEADLLPEDRTVDEDGGSKSSERTFETNGIRATDARDRSSSEAYEGRTETSGQSASRATSFSGNVTNDTKDVRKPNVTSKLSPSRTPGAREFISYIAVQPDEEDTDPDGLSDSRRRDLEERSIQLILAEDPNLERTSSHNPGFDLCERNSSGEITKWIEGKAMTGTLDDRPVGISGTQFDYAGQHGEAYWLYIVERADDREHASIVRIQDPAGKARNFTFDHGWRRVAEITEPVGAS